MTGKSIFTPNILIKRNRKTRIIERCIQFKFKPMLDIITSEGGDAEDIKRGKP